MSTFYLGADNRTCSERSERNSISEQVYLQSVAPAAQRAGANKRSAVCRQNEVLFQVRCRMKKDNPFGLSFFGADNRTCSERNERNSGTGELIRGSGASTLNDLLQATMLRIRAMNRTIVGYVRCARFPQMQALASLFACGQLHSLATIRT